MQQEYNGSQKPEPKRHLEDELLATETKRSPICLGVENFAQSKRNILLLQPFFGNGWQITHYS